MTTNQYTPPNNKWRTTAIILIIMIALSAIIYFGNKHLYQPALDKEYQKGIWDGQVYMVNQLNTNKAFPLVCGNRSTDVRLTELTQICSGKTIQELCGA